MHIAIEGRGSLLIQSTGVRIALRHCGHFCIYSHGDPSHEQDWTMMADQFDPVCAYCAGLMYDNNCDACKWRYDEKAGKYDHQGKAVATSRS